MQDHQEHHVTVTYAGPIGWTTGWMFTIGFAQLSVGKALLALALWPYFLGVQLSA